MTKPITQRVKSKISSLPNGTTFASNSFNFGNINKNSIEKELSALTAKGIIRRFRRGVYYKPQKSSFFGEVLPSPSSIAKTIATLNDARIVPDGSMSLHMLGLSDQVPMKYIYLNNKLHKSEFVGKVEIVFKRINSKKLMASGKKAGLVLSAMEHLGNSAFNDQKLIYDFAQRLNNDDIKDLQNASKGYPLWVQQKVQEMIDEVY
ncbi:MAG: DUF6088 family protein [Sulfurospirillaceae bacterium]|nr:DUF6088 family protein [Sulfurospirillaceae bacterium]